MAQHEHGTIVSGRKVRRMTDDGIADKTNFIATSLYTGESAEFPGYSNAAWWLKLIGERVLSEEYRLSLRHNQEDEEVS